MPEVIIDGAGSGYALRITPEGAMPISGAIGVDMSGISITAGSSAYIYGKSGTGWIPVLVDENGMLSIVASVSTGSETWIRGGSVQTYNPVGIGSNLITNFPMHYPGSVWQGGGPWNVLGSAYITNPSEVGSIGVQSISGNVLISGTVTTGSKSWVMNSLITKYYDAGSLALSGTAIGSVFFYSGGTAGTLQSTLVLSYSGGELVKWTVT